MKVFFYPTLIALTCGLIAVKSFAAVPVDPDADAVTRGYSAALRKLSPAGKQNLTDNQTQWQSYLAAVCGGNAACIKEKDKARTKNLETAAVQIGPYLFTRVDNFAATGGSDVHVSYPRIDTPSSDVTEKWNALIAANQIAQTTHEDGACTNADGVAVKAAVATNGFHVETASADMISVGFEDATTCPGSTPMKTLPHGATYLLTPYVRPLRTPDLFDDKTEWKDFITARLVAAIKDKTDGEGFNQAAVKVAATSPNSWMLGKAGLTVRLAPYDILGDTFTETDVQISWNDLKPYLASDAKVPN